MIEFHSYRQLTIFIFLVTDIEKNFKIILEIMEKALVIMLLAIEIKLVGEEEKV